MNLRRLLFWVVVIGIVWWAIKNPSAAVALVDQVIGIITTLVQAVLSLFSGIAHRSSG